MRSTTLAGLVAVALGLGGCAGSDAYYGTSVGYGYSNTPDLAYVAPGVSVVADYDVPVFYSNGLYWRYDSGYWYRSPYYTGGWTLGRPPAVIARIDRPYRYTHYRPHGYVVRNRPLRTAPIVRRDVYRDRGYYRDYRNRPVYRDDRGRIYRR